MLGICVGDIILYVLGICVGDKFICVGDMCWRYNFVCVGDMCWGQILYVLGICVGYLLYMLEICVGHIPVIHVGDMCPRQTRWCGGDAALIKYIPTDRVPDGKMMYSNAGVYARADVPSSSSPCSSVHHADHSCCDESVDSASDSTADNTPDYMDHSSQVVSVLDITRRTATLGISKTHHPQTEDAQLECETPKPRDVVSVQKLWQEYAADAASMYPISMWRMLNATKLDTKKTQTNVLRACVPLLQRSELKAWPRSRRGVDEAILKKLGSFHSRITRRVMIDLSHHQVPGLVSPIAFTFIDPIFAWSVCAHKLSRTHDLHFEYHPLFHPTTGEQLYGASVAHGEIMRRACEKARHGSRRESGPALIGVSFDSGQASRRRSYTPIIVSVGNTDYSGLNSCICIAYMPVLNLGSAVDKPNAKDAIHELKQTCIGAILDVIEGCAKDGFTCLLCEKSQNKSGYVQLERLLFPVLARMELDTKERFKFFCCARQHACAIGSGPRQAHSALRPCTPHSLRGDLAAKRQLAGNTDCEETAQEAANSLSRRGIHPYRQCTALTGRKHCVRTSPPCICTHHIYIVTHHIYPPHIHCYPPHIPTTYTLIPTIYTHHIYIATHHIYPPHIQFLSNVYLHCAPRSCTLCHDMAGSSLLWAFRFRCHACPVHQLCWLPPRRVDRHSYSFNETGIG